MQTDALLIHSLLRSDYNHLAVKYPNRGYSLNKMFKDNIAMSA